MSNDKRTPDDDAFNERASALFRDSVEGLDGQTRSRLNRGRQQALEAAAAKPRFASRAAWVPAGATAAVAALALVMWNGSEMPDTLPAGTVASDFEILMDDEDLEMLEDLEFYSWMGLEEELDLAADEHVG